MKERLDMLYRRLENAIDRGAWDECKRIDEDIKNLEREIMMQPDPPEQGAA